jgi:tetratricopeptide (TPR) repeat protein
MRCSLLTLAVLVAAPAALARPALRGGLEPGPWHVGYRTLLLHDLARPPLADPDQPDLPSAPGRAVQVSVWYPALDGGAAMALSDYAAELAREIDFRPLSPARRSVARAKVLSDLLDWGGDAARLGPALDSLLALPADARRNAPRARGRFPLVVYPAYRSPFSQSILSEHLASHGFVVAATSTKGTFETELDVAVSGIESMTQDLAFVIGAMRTQPGVDASRVGLVGSGISATSCFALAMRNPAVAALVSLDGGITTASEERMLRATPFYDLASISAPLLAIWAPHPDVDPRRLDAYRYSERIVLGFPHMLEAYFQNKGVYEDLSPGLLGKRVEGTRAGFEWASRYIRRFLASNLAADASSRAFLARSPEENGAPADLLTRTTSHALPRPPSILEAKRLVRAQGIAALLARLDELAKNDPSPFPEQRYVDLYGWLGWHRDDDLSRRRALAAHFAAAHPRSCRALFRVGRVAQQLGDKETARRAYDEALALIDGDPDPSLDAPARILVKEQLEKIRASL